jgi:invasion protein IalB
VVEQPENKVFLRINLPPNPRGWTNVRTMIGDEQPRYNNPVRCQADGCFAAHAERRQPAEKFSPKSIPPQSSAPPQPGFVHSPWVKFCGRDKNDPQAKDVCLTVKEARLDTGQFVAGAAVIERAGAEQKLLRVTLPLGMQLMPGVRMFVDGDAPRTGPYVLCVANGCMADFEVNLDFIVKLKNGQQLQVQGINMPGQLASYLLPLGDFAKAFEGPPTDPAQYEQELKRQRDERQRAPLK